MDNILRNFTNGYFRELKQQKVTDNWDDAVEIYKLSVGLQFHVSEISGNETLIFPLIYI